LYIEANRDKFRRRYMDIKAIMIGNRHRTSLGDMESLKRSISEVGLLQPIVVKKGTNELVAGFRRLVALKELGFTELTEGVYVNFIDISSIVRGEHDENICRQDFTISEKVAIFEAMKDEQKRLGIARQIIPEETSSPPGTTAGSYAPGKSACGHGSARTHAAQAVGLHYNTLRKASEIVRAARNDPSRYDRLVKEMDQSGKVEPIFQKYVQERSRPAPDIDETAPGLSQLISQRGLSLPEFIIDALSRIPPALREDLLERHNDVLRTVKRSDIERSVKMFSKGWDIGASSENDIVQLIGHILQHAAASAREWVFLPQVRQVASVMMSVAKAKEPASILDKLDFFMIGLAGFVDMGCNYLQIANKGGILKDIPSDALEKYLAAIDAFQMLYESKLPRQVGALRVKETGSASGNGIPTIRDHVNAMKANEMITNAAEGSIPYYRNLLAGLVQNFREGAQNLKEVEAP
jgi:hypothetical protein